MSTWREQLAWAAGFYDGEGCMTRSSVSSYRISITQNDPEVLHKFHGAVLGVGTVLGPYTHSPNPNPRWYYSASGSRAQAVVVMLWPWLGEVKKTQAVRLMRGANFALPAYDGSPDSSRTCRAGHPYAGNRTRHGQCRACMRETDRRRRASP